MNVGSADRSKIANFVDWSIGAQSHIIKAAHKGCRSNFPKMTMEVISPSLSGFLEGWVWWNNIEPPTTKSANGVVQADIDCKEFSKGLGKVKPMLESATPSMTAKMTGFLSKRPTKFFERLALSSREPSIRVSANGNMIIVSTTIVMIKICEANDSKRVNNMG